MRTFKSNINGKDTAVDIQIIKTTFSRYDELKQVLVYAEALRAERYELLDVLAPCIAPDRNVEFLHAVDLWLTDPKNKPK